MSLFSYNFTPSGVIILSDGITVDAVGIPDHFASKAVPVPHLGLVIGGVGMTRLVADWARMVLFDLLAGDIDDLATAARYALPQIAATADPTPSRHRGGGHTAIYHFGWSERAGQYVVDVFDRSTDFAPERHVEPHWRCRPGSQGRVPLPTDLDEMVAYAKQLKVEYDALPADERIELGGNLDLITMSRSGISVYPAYARYDDYDQMFTAMVARLDSSG